MLPYTTYLIDLDGVIYRGNALLPGALEFVAWLDASQKKYLYLTNNSFASAEQVLAKLRRLGISANAAHMLTAGQAAVQNIARRFPKGTVYVVEKSLSSGWCKTRAYPWLPSTPTRPMPCWLDLIATSIIRNSPAP